MFLSRKLFVVLFSFSVISFNVSGLEISIGDDFESVGDNFIKDADGVEYSIEGEGEGAVLRNMNDVFSDPIPLSKVKFTGDNLDQLKTFFEKKGINFDPDTGMVTTPKVGVGDFSDTNIEPTPDGTDVSSDTGPNEPGALEGVSPDNPTPEQIEQTNAAAQNTTENPDAAGDAANKVNDEVSEQAESLEEVDLRKAASNYADAKAKVNDAINDLNSFLQKTKYDLEVSTISLKGEVRTIWEAIKKVFKKLFTKDSDVTIEADAAKNFFDSASKKLQRQLDDAQGALKDAESDVEYAEKRLERVTAEEGNTPKQLHNNKMQKAERYLKDAQDRLENAKKELLDVKAKNEVLTNKLGKHFDNIKEAQATYKQADAAYFRDENNEADLSDARRSANKDIATQKLENLKLENTIKDNESDLAKVKNRIKEKYKLQDDSEIDDDFLKEHADDPEVEGMLSKEKDIADGKASLKKGQEKLEQFQKEYKQLDNDTHWIRKVGRFIKGLFHALWEGVVMGFAFMIPSDMVQAIIEAEKEKALYKTITEVQTFGGIQMQVVDGMVPSASPTSGVFIYHDSYNSLENVSSYASGKPVKTRIFVSIDQYNNIATQYLGSGQVTQMLEVTTGTVFDASGVVQKMIPLVEPLTVQSNNNNNSNGNMNIQDIISATLAKAANGEVSSETYDQAFGAIGSMKNSAPPGNGVYALWFKPYKNPITGNDVSYAPESASASQALVANILHAVSLTAFRKQALFSQFGFALQELAPNGPLFQSIIDYALADTDLTTLETQFKNASQLKGSVDSPGLAIGTRLVAQGIYLYQSDTTPVAQFMKNQVPSFMQPYIHDYLVCVDSTNSTILPALVTKVNSNSNGQITNPVVQWVPNPNIGYIVSLVTGNVYSPGAGTQQLSGSDASTIATAVLNLVTSTYTNTDLLAQIGAMKFLGDSIVNNGPFQLRTGVFAKRVNFDTSSAVLSDKQIQTIEKNAQIALIGKAAEGIAASQTNTPTLTAQKRSDILKSQGGIYVYEIEDALTGVDGPVSDYVVAVTVDASSGNFVILPLSTKIKVEAGVAQPQISQQITALLSLVTGKIYNPMYVLLAPSFTTQLLYMTTPGTAISCSGSSISVPQSVTCDSSSGNYVQNNGKPVPLATAFMQSDINPANKPLITSAPALQNILMWPYYFLLLSYEYIQASQELDSAGINAQGADGYLKQGFQQFSASTTSLPVTPALYTVLPSEFIGNIAESLKNNTSSGTKKSTTKSTTPSGSIDYSHEQWHQNLLNKNQWSLLADEGPLTFIQNGTTQSWTLMANPVALSNGFYFYTLTPANGQSYDGLWVAATYTGSTAVNQGAANGVFGVVANNVTLSSFTNIGNNFAVNNAASNTNLNALISLTDGQVLISNVVKNVNTITPLMNLFGIPFKFNPSDVQSQIVGKNSPQLIKNMLNAQSQNNSSDMYGPFIFGELNLYITREAVNSGYYIYQVYNGTLDNPQVYDYVVTQEISSQGTVYGNPLNGQTQSMVSLVTGIIYSNFGTSSFLNYVWNNAATQPGEQVIIDTINSQGSGYFSIKAALQNTVSNTIPATLTGDIATLQNAEIAQLQKKLAINPVVPVTYSEAVVGAINNQTSTDMLFTFTTGNLSAIPIPGSVNLYKDTNNNYYIQNNPPASLVNSPANQQLTQGYYAFNIVTSANRKALSNQMVNLVGSLNMQATAPTGLYFILDSNGNVTAQNVLSGAAAQAIAASYGITIDPESGAQTRSLPVVRRPLIMSSGDQNLAGGKDGTYMKLIIDNLTLPAGTYLYQNFGVNSNSTTATTQPDTAKGPVNILLQFNPSQGKPYYLSLLTGMEYTIDGQPMPDQADMYVAQDTQGKDLNWAPLVVWGPRNNMNLVSSDLRIMCPTSNPTNNSQATLQFGEYYVVQGGITYQYTDKTGRNIYNVTSINPTTFEYDGGCYIVTVSGTKNITPSSYTAGVTSALSNGSGTGLQIEQAATTNLSTALKAMNEDYLLSQIIYTMNLYQSSDSNAATQITATQSVVSKQWTIATVDNFPNFSLGSYYPTNSVTPLVTHYIGQRTKNSSSGTLLTDELTYDQSNNIYVGRAILLKNAKTNSINSLLFLDKYFSAAVGQKNVYTHSNLMVQFMKGTSSYFDCSLSNTNSSNSDCSQWSDYDLQLPTDLQYYAITNASSNAPVFFYLPDFADLTQQELKNKMTALSLDFTVTPSNTGKISIVPTLSNASSWTQITPSSSVFGIKSQSLAAYQTAAFNDLATKFDTQKNMINTGAGNTLCSLRGGEIQKNVIKSSIEYSCILPEASGTQQNLKNSAPKMLATTQQNLKNSAPKMLATINRAQAQQVVDYKNDQLGMINATRQQQLAAIETNQQKAEAILTTTFNTIKTALSLGMLYQTSSGQLMMQGNATTMPSTAGLYVTYPTENNSGGFIYNPDGTYTGEMLSVGQMQILLQQLGGLIVQSVNPLQIVAPGVSSSTSKKSSNSATNS